MNLPFNVFPGLQRVVEHLAYEGDEDSENKTEHEANCDVGRNDWRDRRLRERWRVNHPDIVRVHHAPEGSFLELLQEDAIELLVLPTQTAQPMEFEFFEVHLNRAFARRLVQPRLSTFL